MRIGMTIQDKIRSRTADFANDISALVQCAVAEAVQAAVPSTRPVAATKGAGIKVVLAKKTAPARTAVSSRKVPAVPQRTTSRSVQRTAPTATVRKPVARARGAMRAPAELAALVEKLAAHIRRNPGQGAEAIGKALGVATSEMALPIKKLVAAKRIRSEGQKRATKYFPS